MFRRVGSTEPRKRSCSTPRHKPPGVRPSGAGLDPAQFLHGRSARGTSRADGLNPARQRDPLRNTRAAAIRPGALTLSRDPLRTQTTTAAGEHRPAAWLLWMAYTWRAWVEIRSPPALSFHIHGALASVCGRPPGAASRGSLAPKYGGPPVNGRVAAELSRICERLLHRAPAAGGPLSMSIAPRTHQCRALREPDGAVPRLFPLSPWRETAI